MNIPEAADIKAEVKDGVAVNVSARDRSVTADDNVVLEQQTRTRRLFSTSQLFAYSMTQMAVWEAIVGTVYFVLYNGGPNTLTWSTIIAFIGTLCQAASLGEMASILPMAGAQYHWTWHLAPRNIRRFATYIQGWSTWLGYITALAADTNLVIILLESAIELNNPGWTAKGWHTALLMIAICAAHMLLNMYFVKLIPWLEMVAGVLHVCLFVIFVVVMAVMGSRHDASFVFVESSTSSGWEKDPTVAWNIGMLTAVTSFVGFDGAIHMSEETRKARLAVPRAMFWSIFTNGILAFVMVIVLLVSMGSIEDALLAASPIESILLQITGSKAATTAMMVGLFIIAYCSSLGLVASVSRLSWAWARDGGLPSYFAYVHPKHRVPVRAILLCVFIVCLLSLLNIGSASYVAFGAITSLLSLALYTSYFIAISSMIYARYYKEGGVKLGEWNWGRWGGPMNVFAWFYTLYVAIWLPFPTTLPVTASNMNYCGPVMVAVLVIAITAWFGWARKNWLGPNVSVMDFIAATS
ncbi:hypothetical protein VPNG_02830 [Cytospora leucostoma]|uniref:Amino acid permease/ SLC12A domain-containing protein n=1 Tax=Cytospora leucostoma TaxID=1230097 RepID=A0A423XJ44_9PEZI|nr:hypothetical protein VPNG_02830 [Cytospora leucostoma]